MKTLDQTIRENTNLLNGRAIEKTRRDGVLPRRIIECVTEAAETLGDEYMIPKDSSRRSTAKRTGINAAREHINNNKNANYNTTKLYVLEKVGEFYALTSQ